MPVEHVLHPGIKGAYVLLHPGIISSANNLVTCLAVPRLIHSFFFPFSALQHEARPDGQILGNGTKEPDPQLNMAKVEAYMAVNSPANGQKAIPNCN